MDIADIKIKYDASQAKAGAKEFEHATDRIKRQVTDLGSGFERLKKLTGALAGFAGFSTMLYGLKSMAKEAFNAADKIAKLSQSTGVSVERLSALSHAADLSGVNIDTLGRSFGLLSKNMAIARDASDKTETAFEQLNIRILNNDGTLRSTNDVMNDVADRFRGMEDGAQKTALAMEIFGRSGAELIPLLNAGSDGLRAMEEEAHRLGLTFDEETAKQAERVNDNITKITGAVTGLTRALSFGLLPTLEKITSAIDKIDINKFAAFMGQAAKWAWMLSPLGRGSTLEMALSAIEKLTGADYEQQNEIRLKVPDVEVVATRIGKEIDEKTRKQFEIDVKLQLDAEAEAILHADLQRIEDEAEAAANNLKALLVIVPDADAWGDYADAWAGLSEEIETIHQLARDQNLIALLTIIPEADEWGDYADAWAGLGDEIERVREQASDDNLRALLIIIPDADAWGDYVDEWGGLGDELERIRAIVADDNLRALLVIIPEAEAWGDWADEMGGVGEAVERIREATADENFKALMVTVPDADAWGDWANEIGGLGEALDDARAPAKEFQNLLLSLNRRVEMAGLTGMARDIQEIRYEFQDLRMEWGAQGINDFSVLDALEQKLIANARATEDLDSSWERLAENLQSNLADVFFNVLDGADNVFEGIVKSWKRMIANMLAEAAVLKAKEWMTGTPSSGGIFQGVFANLPWIGSLFGGGQAGAYQGGISPNSNIWDIGAGGNYQQPSRPPFNATPYLMGGSLASSMMPASAGGGFGGWLQGGMSGASMGSMAGPWGALAGGVIGSAYGGYQSGFYNSSLGKANIWNSILEGTPFGASGLIASWLGLPGLGGDEKETPGVVTSIQGGEWDVARRGGSEWPVQITRSVKAGILSFGVEFADLFSTEFKDVLNNASFDFKSDATTYAGVVTETTANLVAQMWKDLFGTESLYGLPMTGAGNIVEKWQGPDESWSEAMLRLIQTMQGFVTFIGETDQAIAQLTANDQGLSAFQYSAGQMDDSIAKLKSDIDEFANESWERLDPTDVLERAQEVRAAIIERYDLEKAYVEQLAAQLIDVQRASYEFNLRLQTKVDALTGSTDAIGIAAARFADLRNEFVNTNDFDRQIALLGELETGLDTILSMQSAVHQAEIDRLNAVLAMLEQLRSASEAITEKIFSLTGQGESGYIQQAGYYYQQLMNTFREYQGMNWGQPETLEDRIRLVNEMAGWLDQTVNAVMARWEAHYDSLIASAQTEIENLEAQKSGIAEQISDLNEQKSAIQESYRTQMEALEEQIRAAEQWKRLSESIADQIFGMKLDWSNQQDIFERMDIARAEISRVQGLYAGAGSDEERIGYAGQLQNLYGDLLNLGQEAWQRPSPEYQSLYEEVLRGLEALQSDANSNAGDTVSLQAELNELTGQMNDELKTVNDAITELNYQSEQIDQQIAGYRSDIAGYERDKIAVLNATKAEAAIQYTWIQGEMTALLGLQDDIEADLKSEQLAMNDLQTDFGQYYKDLKDAGSAIYAAEEAAITSALRAVIGNETVESYLTQLAQYTGTRLQEINDTMTGIASQMGVPGYASGGVAWSRQLAWVGENRPEVIASFPQLAAIARMMQPYMPEHQPRGGDGGTVIVNATIAPNVSVDSGGAKLTVGDIKKAVNDICVESVKRGPLREAIKNETRYWK